MKILITGYTTRQFGSQRIHGDYVTFSFLLEAILKEMGHVVERRQVIIPEELAYVYDYAFCGVAPVSSMTSGKVVETHYVMDMMTNRHAIYADDWSFCGYGGSVRYALDRWERYLAFKKFPYDEGLLESTRQSLSRMMSIQNPSNNAPVLCPMFKWGDHDFLMNNNYKANLITVDPSGWVKFPDVNLYSPSHKKKQWVMAALSDHSPWVKRQNFSFPIAYIGNKRKNLVYTETQTVRLFAESFGVLSCGYPSAGSGWWRTRYVNTAWAESVMYSDPKDAAVMGEPYQGSPWDFEFQYGTRAYVDRVKAQIEWLNKNLMSKDEAISVIEGLIAK
jgi:hypothetical protein